MNKSQMLRLLQEYPLNDDEFEWKWFGTLKFANSATLRNAEKILLQWRNEIAKYEGSDSLNILWVMECSRIGICFHVVVGGHRINDKKRWLSRWQELGGVGALHRYWGDGCVFEHFATSFRSDSAFDCDDRFGGMIWYISDHLLQRMGVRGCCIGAQPECQLWSRKC